MGYHKCRTLNAFDDIGQGEGLARPGHPQERLVPLPLAQPPHDRINGLRLIARRSKFGLEME